MKKICFFLLAICLIGTACKEDEPENTDENELFLYAKVENAAEFSNVVEVKLMAYDRNGHAIEVARGDWKGDGFTIVLPEMLDIDLRMLIGHYSEFPIIISVPDWYESSTLTVSDENVNVGHAVFWGVDQNGNVVANFRPFKIDEGGNAEEATFTYVDSGVSICGKTERPTVVTETECSEVVIIEGQETISCMNVMYEYKHITTYSVNWKKGWTFWYLSHFMFGPPERIITDKWSTISNQQMVWRGN